jgi:hypothetical protein
MIWSGDPRYRIGEPIEFYFTSDRDAYIYIFNVDSQGYQTQLFPNAFDDKNRVRAGEVHRIPNERGRHADYTFRLSPPPGVETMTIVALTEKYEGVDVFHRYNPAEPFAPVTYSPMDYLKWLDSRYPGKIQAGMARLTFRTTDGRDDRREDRRDDRRDDRGGRDGRRDQPFDDRRDDRRGGGFGPGRR